MINRTTGDVDFQSGLHILPHGSIRSLSTNAEAQKLALTGWNRHVLGFHASEHGTFEVEVLSAEDARVHIVLLAHQHVFYEPGTPGDAERRAFHEGIISSDLAGQREFAWGEVICRLERAANKDWLVLAYSREAKVPRPVKEFLARFGAEEKLPEEDN